jgi:hypothetical membrane protein
MTRRLICFYAIRTVGLSDVQRQKLICELLSFVSVPWVLLIVLWWHQAAGYECIEVVYQHYFRILCCGLFCNILQR